MLWLTWRQFRAQAGVALGALALLAVVVLLTGWHLHHLYDASGLSTCETHGNCSAAATAAFAHTDTTLRTWLGILVVVAPGVVGVFWGAPLVARELEAGTFRLAWTQSITRTRWLAVKLVLLGLATMVALGLLTLMITWWAAPLDRVMMNRFGSFDQRDIAPIGYAAFAFVLGVTAGTAIRRTLPAMATTALVFLASRLAFSHWIRPHLAAQMVRGFALNPASTGYGSSGILLLGSGPSNLQPTTPDIPTAWITSTQIVNTAGHTLTSQVLTHDCPYLAAGGAGAAGGQGTGPASPAAQHTLHDCVIKVGAAYRQMVSYQPSSHYWTLQVYELASFLALALLLAGVCFWRIRRGSARRSIRNVQRAPVPSPITMATSPEKDHAGASATVHAARRKRDGRT
jgi:hypothetical protein